MSICLDEICLIKKFLMLRFGLVRLVKSKPQTKPNNAVEQENDPIKSEPNAVFCSFGLGWFGLRCFYLVGSVLNTPSGRCSCLMLCRMLEHLMSVGSYLP